MPQVDVEWPSEDEDFDAKAGTTKPARSATKSRPSITKVADQQPETSGDVDAAPEQTETDETEAPAPQGAEPASAETFSDRQPDPDPLVENEAATLAADVDNQPAAISKLPTKNSSSSRFSKPGMFNLRVAGEAVLVIAVVALGLWSWNLYNDRKDLQTQVKNLNANPQSVVQKQTQQLITKVSSLMQLPSGETPTVAEVSDANQAKQQSTFFANAQNGDRVLMYVKAGEAILYRPSTNKIVLVAPLVFTNSGSTSSTNKAATPGTASSTGATTKGTTTSK